MGESSNKLKKIDDPDPKGTYEYSTLISIVRVAQYIFYVVNDIMLSYIDYHCNYRMVTSGRGSSFYNVLFTS